MLVRSGTCSLRHGAEAVPVAGGVRPISHDLSAVVDPSGISTGGLSSGFAFLISIGFGCANNSFRVLGRFPRYYATGSSVI
jgi:hypothetical protein